MSHNPTDIFELGILSVYVFLLAVILGLELVRRVSPLLHTPLMSLTNAISAISVVGGILIAGGKDVSTLCRKSLAWSPSPPPPSTSWPAS